MRIRVLVWTKHSAVSGSLTESFGAAYGAAVERRDARFATPCYRCTKHGIVILPAKKQEFSGTHSKEEKKLARVTDIKIVNCLARLTDMI